jgi:prepilin-type N-terminal cleavage/methylation domain-containing protein
MKKNNNLKGFTLIELLVVIAIIAILAVVVVLTLNPAQLLAQSRDSNRVSDMATLKSAIALYQVDQATTTMGTPLNVYEAYGAVIPTSSLLAAVGSSTGWGYISASTASASTTRGVDSTGWLPIPLSRISSGAPFNALPIDPSGTGTNTSCALNLAPCTYTYMANSTGQYKLAVKMESTKYNAGGSGDVVTPDGGNSTSTYEVGSNVNL